MKRIREIGIAPNSRVLFTNEKETRFEEKTLRNKAKFAHRNHQMSQSTQQHRLPAQSLSSLLSSQRPLAPISTGIQNLNHSLNGGVVPGQIYEVSGLNNSGRRQFTQQLCQNALDMNKKVIWISCLGMVRRKGVETVWITSITKLFLFLQCHISKVDFGLIIIEDLSIIMQKQLYDLKLQAQKSDTKRNKILKTIFKVLQTHCNQFRSAVLVSNPVETINMQFIESHPAPSTISSSQPLKSSQRPMIHYQQILKSALGDHPTWSSLIRARLTLYKDWLHHTPVNYIHLKHNPILVRKFLQYSESCLIPRIYNFEVNLNGDGIQEVDRSQDLGIVTIDHSFVLNGDDLASSDEEEEDDEEDNDDDPEPEPPSSLPKDIHNVKEMVRNPQEMLSLLTNASKKSFEIFSRDMEHDFSTSTVDIEDELEELYPTQPESLSFVQLSQLEDKENQYHPRKRQRLALEEEEIPSTAPYF